MPVTDINVTQALHQRRSVRAFTDRAVDPALLKEIFAAAQRAQVRASLMMAGIYLLGTAAALLFPLFSLLFYAVVPMARALTAPQYRGAPASGPDR